MKQVDLGIKFQFFSSKFSLQFKFQLNQGKYELKSNRQDRGAARARATP